MKNIDFQRLAGLDFLRGVAVVGMIGYHALYLLNFYDLVVVDFGQVGLVVWARVVQFLFLGLVGVGMALSSRRAGFVKRQLKRVGLIGLMAGVVSAATFVVIPDFFVRFGILHLIAVSSFCLMWIAKWRLLVLAVGVGALFLPFSFLDSPSVDYFPLFPWISVVAGGVLLSDFVVGDMTQKAICGVNCKAPLSPYWFIRLWRSLFVSLHLILLRHVQEWILTFKGVGWVNFLGKNSLWVYMLHVPLMWGVIFLYKN